MISRPPQITESHLRRQAVVYIRQSTEEQVRHSIGSTALQRDLAGLLGDWGWSEKYIEVIDEDLGISGSHASLRHGFKTLIQRMEAGTIGIVAVIDISRLTRNTPDLLEFAVVARRKHVLLLQGGQVTDFDDPNSEFVGMILGLNAARENRARVELAQRARRKKAEAGFATTATPAGYVRAAGGTWVKDPDERVRQVIQLVFDKFRELGSLGRVQKCLKRNGLQLPGRRRQGTQSWSAPTRQRIFRILRNPAYAGTYVFGSTQTQEGRRVLAPEGQRLYTRDHHEAYIAPDLWSEIQERLAANRYRARPPMGRGDALVQGLLRCTIHQVSLRTSYPVRERRDGRIIRRAFYRCYSPDGEFCTAARASLVDQLIESELFRVLVPPATDIIEEVGREALREHEALVRLRETELHRADREVAELERAHDQVNGTTQPLVKQRFSERLEEALRRRARLRSEQLLHPLTPPFTLKEAELSELRHLLNDLPALWRHPSVTSEQRKAIVRAVIKTVQVTPTPESWKLEIEWVGVERTPLEFFTAQAVRTMIEGAYQEGRGDSEITQMLADRGVVRRSGPNPGRRYSRNSVRELIRKMELQRAFDDAADAHICERAAQGISARQIADELNARKIRHRLGSWTEYRVRNALSRLRQQRTPGVEALPRRWLAERVRTLHKEGLPEKEMIARLQVEGARTLRRRPISENVLRGILRRYHLPSHAAVQNQRFTEQLKKWVRTLSVPEIAQRANESGFRTRLGTPWTEPAIHRKLTGLGLRPRS